MEYGIVRVPKGKLRPPQGTLTNHQQVTVSKHLYTTKDGVSAIQMTQGDDLLIEVNDNFSSERAIGNKNWIEMWLEILKPLIEKFGGKHRCICVTDNHHIRATTECE